ncbi:MAG: preprotein translocase subunit SecG [Gammaproteobacteria bacterium]|nr:preprotein translocase subunit SecG [Gammaproteobacteria bacterium]
MLYTILEILLVFVAVAMIVLILLQQGKGADAGAAFGAGASGTVFGAQGSANFLSHATAVLAAIFFILALAMAYFSNHSSAPQSIVERALQRQSVTQTAAPAPVKETAKTQPATAAHPPASTPPPNPGH